MVESIIEKLSNLPEAHLEKSKKIDALKGSLSSDANPKLNPLENKAFEQAIITKHYKN